MILAGNPRYMRFNKVAVLSEELFYMKLLCANFITVKNLYHRRRVQMFHKIGFSSFISCNGV
uniref:Uncharacterized protein n=1 Tax=Octopus bimaculoides TaxID=37653 RepID=A0A0L8HWL2_OCTBM